MRTLLAHELTQLTEDYQRDGFAYIRGLFDVEDLAPLADSLDDGASPGAFAVSDSAGGKQELAVWMRLADDLVGVVPRLEPMADIATNVIGSPVYHWHSKLSWKRPHAKSLWDWHQDYGFWADDGVARADMCTIAIAIGPVTEANGCMKLVRASHHLGRLDVVPVGQSRGTDPNTVSEVLDSHDVELCELAPGDAVVFHGNTLHGSGPNETDVPRTMLMSSYNAVSNPPLKPRSSAYLPRELDVVPSSAIRGGWTGVFGSSAFVDPLTEGIDQGYSVSPGMPEPTRAGGKP